MTMGLKASDQYDVKLNTPRQYDIAIVGGGLNGMALASALGVLTNLRIVVVDKRPVTTRDHSIRIGYDGVDKIIDLIDRCLIQKTPNVKVKEAQGLRAQLHLWRKHNVMTSAIENDLSKFVREKLGMEVYRDETYGVTEENYDAFVASTGASIIIGSDGDKSVIKKVIGAKRVEELTVGHILELKYKVVAKDFEARKPIKGSIQATIAEGWDFETLPKKKPGEAIVVSLHKFIDLQTHLSLLDKRTIDIKGKPTEITKGTPEHAWTMKELEKLAQTNETAKKIHAHITRYFNDHHIGPEDYEKERIVSFPLMIGRSDVIAVIYKGKIVILSGDASSTGVLNRGGNKAFIEAALLCEEIMDYWKTKLAENPKTLPAQFERYKEKCRLLFLNEKWWAVWKNRALVASEFPLKVFAKSLKWTLYLFSIPFRIVLYPFRGRF